MPTDYTPRRCSKRWLDGDCPAGVLAIFDYGPKENDRYDIFYAEPIGNDTRRRDMWLGYVSVTESGATYHGEMEAYKVADYRYRQKHRYTKWSDLPAKVQAVVRKDLEENE